MQNIDIKEFKEEIRKLRKAVEQIAEYLNFKKEVNKGYDEYLCRYWDDKDERLTDKK